VDTQNTESVTEFEKEVERLVDEPSLNDTRAIGEWLPDYVHQVEVKARILDQLLGATETEQANAALSGIMSEQNRQDVGALLQRALLLDRNDTAVSGVVRRLSQLIVAQDVADQFYDRTEELAGQLIESAKRAKSLTDSAVQIKKA